jgi:integrase
MVFKVYLHRGACLQRGEDKMSITSYKQTNGEKRWKADFWLSFSDRPPKRVIKTGIYTKELAKQFERKSKVSAFEGTYFDKQKVSKATVKEAWEAYQPVGKRDRKDWVSVMSRMVSVIEYFGKRRVKSLTVSDVDLYRAKRSKDTTRMGSPPAVATVNREVAMLRLVLNHAVSYKLITTNPLKDLKMVPENNTRECVITPEQFQRLWDCAEEPLKPILVVAFETGMRKGEILGLQWSQVDLNARTIRLTGRDTKTKSARIIALSPLVIEALEGLARSINGYVFVNPSTGRPWNQIKKVFNRAKCAAGLEDIWFHDLRRSFVTNWRRQGVPESVIMKMSGHTTHQVFSRYNIIAETDLHSAVAQVADNRRVISN